MVDAKELPPMLMVGNVLVHMDVVTEMFCCDIDKCHGLCCEEGDAGAPVTLDEIAGIENELDRLWPYLSAGAQAMIDKQGVTYADPEGEMVTTIVGGRDCAFPRLHRLPPWCQAYQLRPVSHTSEGVQRRPLGHHVSPLGHLPRCRGKRARNRDAFVRVPARTADTALRHRLV